MNEYIHYVIAVLLVIAVVVILRLLPKITWRVPESLKPSGKQNYVMEVVVPLVGVTALVLIIKYSLPDVWKWWYQDGTAGFFWASLASIALLAVMFSIGTRGAKWVGGLTVLVLIAGTMYHLPTWSWSTETTVASKASSRGSAICRTFTTRTVRLPADTVQQVPLFDCNMWFDVKSKSPPVIIKTIDKNGQSVNTHFYRGDQPLIETQDGVAFLSKRKGKVSWLNVMYCPSKAAVVPKGCYWNGKLYKANNS